MLHPAHAHIYVSCIPTLTPTFGADGIDFAAFINVTRFDLNSFGDMYVSGYVRISMPLFNFASFTPNQMTTKLVLQDNGSRMVFLG